ncbi:XkdX family protein [Bacillus sp. J33]|nr:XkdX family protein [Bacillus sp. J33]
MYADVKYYYDRGFYTNDNVKVFVRAEWITPEQYQEITNEPYVL